MLNSFAIHQQRLVSSLSLDFKRYLYPTINWESRLLALLGARGVGKTTLILQHYLEKYHDPSQCLYILGDDLDVLRVGLRETARVFDTNGGKVLIIDEVHKYPNWSQEIKNIYDLYPQLQLIISGSSNINITKEKYDLSRRVVTYHLSGLSFREFLNYEYGTDFPPYELEDIFSNHSQICSKVNQTLSDSHSVRIIPAYRNYLHYGYYPYYKENIPDFESRLINVLDKVFHEDIPSVHNLDQSSIIAIKKLITLIGSSHPFTVDISKIASSLNISRNYIYLFIEYLLEAELLIQAMPTGQGYKLVRKPSKLFLNNPNLYYVVGKLNLIEAKIGTIRETFACNQLVHNHKINIPEDGDILVDDKYTLEIGGEDKDFTQIKQLDNAYVFADDLEYGYQHKIPLWLLGFLY